MAEKSAKTIQYYFTPVSPWAYLGHERFCAIARKAHAVVEVLPVDYATIFPASGGLPLGKRAPQRQAYRLVELKRISEYLGVLLNTQPRHFPADPTAAAQLIVAVATHDGVDTALKLTGVLMTAVWAKDRNIADADTLAALLAECGLPAQRLEQSHAAAAAEQVKANTQRALEAGVFGAPSYVVDGEIFWGQDRLDYLERRLAAG
jgi:2-hydroxychromene-2-carboxylate isomerase